MNPAEATEPNYIFRSLTKLLIGLSILTIGLLWTLDNMDLIESEAITQWWPVVVMVTGIVRFFDPTAGKVASVVITLIGLGLLLDTLDVWDFDLGDFFPLFIALIGVKLVSDVFRRRNVRTANGGAPDALVHAFAVMSGVGRRSVSTDFRGGDANAIMGGVEIDLRNAEIQPGQEVVLDTFAMWGGIEIKVPENWRVVSEVFPLMGAFEDNTANKTAGTSVLIVRGVVLMGAIEVKN
jgi:predicted membrane protein